MGTVKIAECRDIPKDAPRAIPQVLERGKVNLGYSTKTAELRLEYIPEGWACAGSVMRYDTESYRVSFEMGGTRHGQRFKTESEARSLFNAWNWKN